MKNALFLIPLLLNIFSSADARGQGIIGADTIITFAGTGISGYSGDSGPATDAKLSFPQGVAVDAHNNLYIVDVLNWVIRRVDTNGIITTVFGAGCYGYSGDGGPATAACFETPFAVMADKRKNIYISDIENGTVRKVDSNGIIITIVGTGVRGHSGNGGPATAAQIGQPTGIALDSKGNLYISDHEYFDLRKVDTAGIITEFAGTGVSGLTGNGGVATAAELLEPQDIACDKYNNIYVCDGGHWIRRIDTNGIINIFAGTGVAGYSGDGGPATAAQFSQPDYINIASSGVMYVSEPNLFVIRKIDTDNIVTTVAGNDTCCHAGDGGPATAARISQENICTDNYGNLIISQEGDSWIRKVFFNPNPAALFVPSPMAISEPAVFPNPFSNEITIANAEGMQVSLTDATGREVYKAVIKASPQTVQLNRLCPDVYEAVITSRDGKRKNIKVVKL